MRAWACGLAVLALSGCMETATDPATTGVQMALPAGYPPQIGAVTADLGGVARGWSLYDYSVGAHDASVQVLNYNGKVRFRLMGDVIGKPSGDVDRLVIGADMARQTQTGALGNPVIEIVAGKDWNAARLSSVGSAAVLVLDSLTPMGPHSEYGHVTGHFSAVLCAATGNPAQVDRAQCQPFKGSFSSDLQIGGP